MADMINNSRLSNGVRAAGLMRRALTEGQFIARERRAFGKRLADMPLMRRQLLKLTLPTEQARTMVFQTAEALRRADAGDADAYPLMRILTPLIKFRACRDARKVTGDAMEIRGGCGYIEEWSDPRLVRDAHLGSIWEGTSNIVALDVLRAPRGLAARAAGTPAGAAWRYADARHCARHVRPGPGQRRRAGDPCGRCRGRWRRAGASGGFRAVSRDQCRRHGMGSRPDRFGSPDAAGATGAGASRAAAGSAGGGVEPEWLAETVEPPADGVVRAAGPWTRSTCSDGSPREHPGSTVRPQRRTCARGAHSKHKKLYRRQPIMPQWHRRAALAALTSLVACTLTLTTTPAFAQKEFPSKPIMLVVTYPPGGPTDAMARTLAAALKNSLGQPVVVENRAARAATSARKSSRAPSPMATR
jgi:hypothetical protein